MNWLMENMMNYQNLDMKRIDKLRISHTRPDKKVVGIGANDPKKL